MIRDREHEKPRIDTTVAGIWAGTLIWGILCEAVGVFIAKDRIGLTVGVISGTLLSCAATYHIWHTLDKSLGDADEKGAARRVGGGYLIRYMALIVLIVILFFTGRGNPFAAFAAYLGMKPAAYMQPYIHSRFTALKEKKNGRQPGDGKE